MNNESSVIKIDNSRNRYLNDNKFKALVNTLFHLVASGEFTTFELKQALDLALEMREERIKELMSETFKKKYCMKWENDK